MERRGLSETQMQEQIGGALVVAVDASPRAAVALRFAAELAVRTGSALHVLLVWNLIIGPAPDATPGQPATEQDRQAEAERVLSVFVEQALADSDRPTLHLHAVHGNVDSLLESISRAAQHLIVGSRGRGGVAGLLLGSTSGHLVSHARCPITVVPSGRD